MKTNGLSRAPASQGNSRNRQLYWSNRFDKNFEEQKTMENKCISVKFSISAIALSAVLILTNSATASAEAYKTSKGAVVVTGLTPTQRYQIRTLSVENKPGTRQDKSANRCGEVVVEKADQYQTLVVGTETIDPATLPIQIYVKCRPKAPPTAMTPSGVILATPPEPK